MGLTPVFSPKNAKAWLGQPGLIKFSKNLLAYLLFEEDEEEEELEDELELEEDELELEVEGLLLEDELEELVVDEGREDVELVEELGAVRTVVEVAGGVEGRDGAGETLVVAGRLGEEVDGLEVAGR